MPNFTKSNARPARSTGPPKAGPPVDGIGGPVSSPNPQGGPACNQVTKFQVSNPGDPDITLFGNLTNNAHENVIWDSVTFFPDDPARWSVGDRELAGTQLPGATVQISMTFKPPAK